MKASILARWQHRWECTVRELAVAQERQVFRWVNGKRPDQYGFDFGLWTRQVVQELVLQRFEVSLSRARIGALLARLSLTAQKSLQRAYQRDPDAVARWKSQTCPAIADEAQGGGANSKKPVRLVVDGLPARKSACVKEYVASTHGKLMLHFLPGYVPDLNPSITKMREIRLLSSFAYLT